MAAKVAGTWAVLSPIGMTGSLTTIDTTAAFRLGQRITARDMSSTTDYGDGEFVYLKGVTSCARGSVCTFTSGFVAVLIVAKAKGPVCVALGAVDASTKYGWFQIKGKGVALCDSGITDGAALFIDTNTAQIDDTAVTGDVIIGMHAASTDDTGTCVVHMAVNPVVADYDNA